MSQDTFAVPEQLPLLSRGKHRSPRKGACFMELASYLAGERWSDHPACTHPLLAAAARCVNDFTTDQGRSQLGVLIPDVIGLTSDDPHVDARIALHCARVALPVVAAERQRVMAVGVLTCERVLDHLDGRPSGTLQEPSRRALELAPGPARWARSFSDGQRISLKRFRRHAAPCIVSSAVEGIARACVSEPDRLLRELLVGAIGECAALVRDGDSVEPLAARRWDDVCALTGVG